MEEAFHTGDGCGLVTRDVFAVQVAGGKDDEDGGDNAGDDTDAGEDASVAFPFPIKQIERADSCHDKRRGNDRASHVVHVLKQTPRIEKKLPEAEYLKLSVGQAVVGDGVLHPGVGDDDEEAGDPRADENHDGREPVHGFRNALLAVEEEAEESRLEEEAEDAFHGKRLADHSAGEVREASPVGSKFELHGNAGDDTEDEIDAEDARPEAGSLIPLVVSGAQCDGLENDDQERKAHGELGKEVMECDSKGKMQPVNELCGHVGLLVKSEGERRDSLSREAILG